MQTCQVIAAALMMGVAVFAGISVVMNLNSEVEERLANDELPINLIVLSVMGTGVLGARIVVLKVQDQEFDKFLGDVDADTVDPSVLMGRFQTRTVISLAMLEGIAFLRWFCLSPMGIGRNLGSPCSCWPGWPSISPQTTNSRHG